jgi:presenilin-like A22 family membrane protease
MTSESHFRNVLSQMAEQWRSMSTMGLMFVGTILLAIYIQPFWDRPEARAFGEAGTTKVGLIGLEFILILVFTAFIIWLAKRGLQSIIKWGVLFVLWISLSYAMIPLASYAMDEPQPIVEYRDEMALNSEILFVDYEPSSFIVTNGTHLIKMSEPSGLETGQSAVEEWDFPLQLHDGGYSALGIGIIDNLDSYVMCDGNRWQQLDKSDGTPITSHTNVTCVAGFSSEENDWAIYNDKMQKVDPFHPDIPSHSWAYNLPEQFNSGEFMQGSMLNENTLLLVSFGWAGIIEIPDSQHTGEFGDVNATILWQVTPNSGDAFTASTFGHSPWSGYNWWDTNATDSMLMLGTENGKVYGYVWDGAEMNVEEHIKFNERDAFDSDIQGIMLADDQYDGRVDVWIASGGETRMFSGWVMVESLTIDGPVSQGPIDMILHTVDVPAWDEIGIEDGILTTYTVNTTQSAIIATPVNDPAIILEDSAGYWLPIYWSQIAALIASTVLMIVLTIRPEWYVVNTTGILTGAGVITIIGVSFVPTLIVIFMVVAAIYDWYAVYKSKHMLDLADTMIGLKLPILLVAPQDKGYSFLDEGNDTMSKMDEPPASAKKEHGAKSGAKLPTPEPPRPIPKKNTGDALFMGLGDVIFPGMLVISALTFLPSGGTIMGLSDPMFVAMGSLMGGLLGYLVLMGYVAMGRPQAGLPLLNGGSILGYLITGFIALGSASISFGITIF